MQSPTTSSSHPHHLGDRRLKCCALQSRQRQDDSVQVSRRLQEGPGGDTPLVRKELLSHSRHSLKDLRFGRDRWPYHISFPGFICAFGFRALPPSSIAKVLRLSLVWHFEIGRSFTWTTLGFSRSMRWLVEEYRDRFGSCFPKSKALSISRGNSYHYMLLKAARGITQRRKDQRAWTGKPLCKNRKPRIDQINK